MSKVMKDTRSTVAMNEKKKKKRTVGSFACDYENCGKTFSRPEHLSRHKLNHNPSVIYKCGWKNCTKTFVRSDLKDRHIRRHAARLKKEQELQTLELKSQKNLLFKGMGTLNFKKKDKEESDMAFLENGAAMAVMDLATNNNSSSNGNSNGNGNGNGAANGSKSKHEDMPTTDSDGAISSMAGTTSAFESKSDTSAHSNEVTTRMESLKTQISTIQGSPFNVNLWIDHNTPSHIDTLGFTASDPNFSSGLFFGNGPNYMEELFESLAPPLDVVTSDLHLESSISEETLARLIAVIPSLASNIDVSVKSFSLCLSCYWDLFHIQFPFLHKPSFVANDAPELLLLPMIMLGAGLHPTISVPFLHDSRALADTICIPIRWKIFESGDIELPVKTWVIQALLILSFYEKFFSSRELHERTFVHHGAIVQLLRRSPTIGGNPIKRDHVTEAISDDQLVQEDEDSGAEKRRQLWHQWVEIESVKRATLMAFYIDSTHSVIFGHQGLLYAHQIQVQMPCDDELWEAGINEFSLSRYKKPRPFLQELRGLLQNQPAETGVFGRRILLSGLLAVIFQLQQRDLQTSALGWGESGEKESWKDYFSYILDALTHDNMAGCCDTKSAMLKASGKRSHYFSADDTRCKCPAYHIAQIIMRVNHYDLIIYGGAPWRMNVKPGKSDYELVQTRMEKWATSTSGRLSVIHALLYLFETYLRPETSEIEIRPATLNYESLTDPIVERAYVLYTAALSVWSYVFITEGVEQDTGGERAEPLETGHDYLLRLRRELQEKTNTLLHCSPVSASLDFYRTTLFQAKALSSIQNKKNVTGLLIMVSESLEKSNWHLSREFAGLVMHCAERSWGKEALFCDYMKIDLKPPS